MEPQAQGPAQAQVQSPAHPIHTEQQTLERLTQYVKDTPDNDPHSGTDMEAPQAPAEQPTEQAAEAPAQEELDEETPFFELEYKTESGVEKKKLSAKELREGWLAKQDYHRNIQKVKAQEAEIQTKVQQATLQAQQEYLQRLEQHKQLVLRTIAPELAQVDLNKLAAEDPAEAQRIFFKQIQLNQTLQSIDAEQRAAATKHQEAVKAAQQQAIQQARQTLEADIPNWNADLYNQTLATVAKEYGFKNEEVAPVVDARLIKVFHDAAKYRQLQQAKPEVSKKVVAVPKVLKPGSAEKPNPASEASNEAITRAKKTGDWRDAAQAYLSIQRSKKRQQ